MFDRCRLIAASLILVLIFASAPAFALSVLNVGMSAEPDSLDPHKSTIIYARSINQQIWLPLVTTDPRGNYTGSGAQSWDVSADGLTYTFHLRPNLKWSDGSPFTSADYIYSFRRMLDPKTLYTSAELYFWIKGAEAFFAHGAPADQLGIKAPDASTLVFSLNAPNPFFLSLMAIAYPVPRTAIEKWGSSWTQAGHIITAGAYTVAERVPNTRIKLVRNPNSIYAKTTSIDQINIYYVGDESALTNRYRAGDLDLVYSVTPNEFDRIKRERPGQAIAFDAARTDFITFNTHRPQLSDPRVRRALSMLIDRDILAFKVVGGSSSPAYELVPPGWQGMGETGRPDYASWLMTRRMSEAKALLAAAGYGPSHPLQFEFIYSGQNRERMAIALRAMWGAAGVKTNLLTKEPSGLFSAYDGGDYEAGILGFDMGLEIDPYDMISGLLPGGWNERSGYRDNGFDRLVNAARIAPSPAERASLLAQAEMRWMTGNALAPLYHERALWFISPVVKGWTTQAQPYFWRDLRVAR